MRKGWKILLGLIVLLLVLAAGAMVVMGGQVREMDKLEFSAADPAAMADGIYKGHAGALLVKADVEVTIRAGRIAGVDIARHDNGMGASAEAVPQAMVAQNTVDVDTVAGATASSLVIKAAALNALDGGETP